MSETDSPFTPAQEEHIDRLVDRKVGEALQPILRQLADISHGMAAGRSSTDALVQLERELNRKVRRP